MIERRQHLGLALEPRHAFRSLAKESGNTFSATSRFQLGVLGAIDLTHAACTDGRKDFVGAEFVAG
jgi:hypothetical protein